MKSKVINVTKLEMKRKLEEMDKLVMQLGRALELTKLDAERFGFTYGSQANCVKALKALHAHSSQRKPHASHKP